MEGGQLMLLPSSSIPRPVLPYPKASKKLFISSVTNKPVSLTSFPVVITAGSFSPIISYVRGYKYVKPFIEVDNSSLGLGFL